MRKLSIALLLTAALSLAIGACSLVPRASADVPLMSGDELKSRLGSPDTIIVDVRAGSDWTGSDRKIQGAVRGDPKDFDAWSGALPKAATLVLYCA